jgi:RNA polymerase sigma-70 factor (ECF subfamily)
VSEIGPLTAALLSRACAELKERAPAATGLEGALAELLERARGAWPQAAPVELLAHVGTLLPPREPLLDALGALHADDLYLAWMCARGEPRALAAFDKRVLLRATRGASRIDPSPAFLDEVRQALRQKLLFPEEGSPRLLEYAGRGPLSSWVRAAALRTALNLSRGHKPAGADSAVAEVPAASLDPEFDYIAARYRPEFVACFKQALDALEPRERTMLRLHLVDGTGVEALARYYRVHRTTITRWLQQTRTALVAEVRTLLTRRLELTRSELDSLVRAVRSRLDFSISQVLSSAVEPEAHRNDAPRPARSSIITRSR